jgi:hypothetical protein
MRVAACLGHEQSTTAYTEKTRTCSWQDDLLVQLSTGCQLNEWQAPPDEICTQLSSVQRVL